MLQFLLIVCLAAAGVSPAEAWMNGFFFQNDTAFAELPPTSLCGQLSFRMDFKPNDARATLLVAYNSRRRILIALQASKPFFNLTVLDLNQKHSYRRQIDSVITLPYMFSDWKALHEFEIRRERADRLLFRIDQISRTVFLHSLEDPFPMEYIRSTRFFISRPPKEVLGADDAWILPILREPSFVGYVRNVRGARDCDCAQHRRISFVHTRKVDISNLEPCEQRNPCGVGCVCISWGREPDCECKSKVKCPEFSSFYYKLGMDGMLGEKIPNQAGLTAEVSGETKVDGEHAVQDKALRFATPGGKVTIKEPPDARTCFSHLAKCEKGFSMTMWLRVENPSLHHSSTIFRHSALAPCRYGFTISYSIAKGLEIEYETQAGHQFRMRTTNLHPERWVHVVLLVPDSQEPQVTLLLDGREQKDSAATVSRDNRPPGTMVKCRSDIVILGNGSKAANIDPEGTHFVLIDNLEFQNPPISRNVLRQLDISHFILTSAGTYGEVYQLQSLGPKSLTFKLTTKGVQKVELSSHRVGALVLTPVTDGVLVLRGREELLEHDPCLFDFKNCMNGVYLSAWIKVGPASVTSASVRLIKWNGLRIMLRNGVPGLELDLDSESWSVVGNEEKLPQNEWVFVEATWDLINGLELWLNRKKQGTFQHSFGAGVKAVGVNPSASPMPPSTDPVLVLGANVEFQLDDFQLRTASRSLLQKMERMSDAPPKHWTFPFNAIKNNHVTAVIGPVKGRIVGSRARIQLTEAKIGKGLLIKAAGKAFVDFGTGFRHRCLGNLNHCPNGLTFAFWLRPRGLAKTNNTPFLMTGYNGLVVSWADNAGHLLVEARTSVRTWSMKSQRALRKGQFNFVEISWDERRGLRIFVNLKLSGTDILPRIRKFKASDRYESKKDRFLLGAFKGPFPKAGNYVLDNLEMWEANRNFLNNWNLIVRKLKMKAKNVSSVTNASASASVAVATFLRSAGAESMADAPKALSDIAYPQYAMVPFEWAFSTGMVPNTRFTIQLHSDAKIVKFGRIGSALNLHGKTKDFVTLGRRFDCYGNLDSCGHGLTLRFWLHPKNLNRLKGRRMMVLASSSYEVFIGSDRHLNFVFKAGGKMWVSRKYKVKKSTWQLIEASYSPLDGLLIYADTYKVDVIPSGIDASSSSLYDDPTIYVGRAAAMDDFDFGDVLLDELQFWHAPLDYLLLNKFAYATNLRRRYFPLEGVQDNRLYGNTSVVARGKFRKATGVQGYGLEFAGTEKSDGSVLDFGPDFLCRENDLTYCPNGFTLRFWIRSLEGDEERKATVFTSGSALRSFIRAGRLHFELWSHGRQWKANTSEALALGRWHLLEVSWQRDEGLLLFVNGQLSGKDCEAKISVLDRRELSGLRLGGRNLKAVIDELEIWNAKVHLVKASGAINRADDNERLLLNLPMSDAGHVGQLEYIRFLGSNFMQYDFTKKMIPNSVLEHMKIVFSTTKPNGLIWMGRQKGVVNFLELKSGALVFHVMYLEPSGAPVDHKYKLKPNTVTDGRKHFVEIVRSRSRVQITSDSNANNDRIVFDGHDRVNLQPRGPVYLGGMPDPKLLQTTYFTGKIFHAKIDADWGRSTDLLRNIDSVPHRSSLGPSAYVLKKNPTGPGPKPPVKPVRPSKDGILGVLSLTKIPYTFYTSISKLYIPPWSFPTMRTMEFEFRTFQPRGLLFFIGSGVHGRAYVAIEIFDDVLYSIYSDGVSNFRTKLSSHPINEDHEHNVLLKIYPEGYIEVRADYIDVPIPKARNMQRFDFASYTYIAGVDVFSLENNRLPWYVWSRTGFIGCINYIKINNAGYFDARKYQDQHSTPDRNIGSCIKPTVKKCQHPSECMHGTCHRRWAGWRDEKNFFCDCSMTPYTYPKSAYVRMDEHEIRGKKCSDRSIVFVSRGSNSQIIDFSPKQLTTHVDHILLEFQTKKKDGALFMSTLPLSQATLRAFMRDGRLYVQTNIYNVMRTPTMTSFVVGNNRYDDGRWHILKFFRRANTTSFSVDKEDPKSAMLPEAPRTYYFKAKKIHVGEFPVAIVPPFSGKLRNFMWNAFDFLSRPFQPNTYSTIFKKKPTPHEGFPLTPSPSVTTFPVTVRDGTNYIRLRSYFLPTDVHGGTFAVVFKTDQPDVNVFILRSPDFVLRLDLKNGRPVYSMDLGTGLFTPRLDKKLTKLHDLNWHQAFVAVHPEDKGFKHVLWIDGVPSKVGDFPKDPKPFEAFLAGEKKKRRRRRRETSSGVKPLTGCFGSAMINGKHMLFPHTTDVSPKDKSTVIFGKCIEPKRCAVGYCKNGGRCVQITWSSIACSCPPHLFEGPRCEKAKPTPKCPPGYCKNDGVCTMKLGKPVCDCSKTGFGGARCDKKTKCPDHFCSNNGVCHVTADDKIKCDCNMTAYGGPRCRQKVPGLLTPYKGLAYYTVPAEPRIPQPTKMDLIAFAFQTWVPNGNIVTFQLKNGQKYSVIMRNGILYLSLDGKREYSIGGPYNDGQYHVINLVRFRNLMEIFHNGASVRQAVFDDYAKAPGYTMNYMQAIVGANASFGNAFRGVIAGFHWNGFFPIIDGRAVWRFGALQVVPAPYDLPKPPTTNCPKDFCKNCGRCYEERNSVIRCDCWRTGYGGNFCDSPAYYGILNTNLKHGKLILNVKEPRGTSKARLRFAFQTFSKTGPLICLVAKNGKYWKLFLRDGYIVLSVNGKDEFSNVGNLRKPVNDGSFKVVTIDRVGEFFKAFVNGCGDKSTHESGAATVHNQFAMMTAYLGVDCTSTQWFRGVIGGFNWRGRTMLNQAGVINNGIQRGGKFEIVRMPYPLLPPGVKPPPPPTTVPPTRRPVEPVPAPVILKAASAGLGKSVAPLVAGLLLALLLLLAALIWACVYCKLGCCGCCAAYAKKAIGKKPLIPSAPFNRFKTPGVTDDLPLLARKGLKSAPPMDDLARDTPDALRSAPPPAESAPLEDIGRDTRDRFESAAPDDMGPESDIEQVDREAMEAMNPSMTLQRTSHRTAAAAGASQGASLLYAKDDAFATLGTLKSHSGHVTGVDHFDSGYHVSDTSGHHYGETSGQHFGEISGHHFGDHYYSGATVGGGVHLDVGMDGSEDTENTMLEQNAFGGELKVDCCQLSLNSKYAVTGSAMGPPQVWELETGSLIKVMDGEGVGCSGLHLACQDSLLIGLVIDDLALRFPRLQLWNFASGRQLSMPMEIVCSTVCVSNGGDQAVIARCEAGAHDGYSILLWNLSSNHPVHETMFMPPSGFSESGITFLKVTSDDRFAVAGFTNSFNQHANYMVFDLSMSYPPDTILSPHVIVFDANVDCTELLISGDEAITGTRQGSLIVWDLNSGRTLRRITITAQLESKLTSTLPAHSSGVNAMALSEDGEFLVTGSADKYVRIWSMSDEKLHQTLEGHEDDVMSVAISVDNELVVSGSIDGSIRVWKVPRNGAQLCWFTSNIDVFDVKLSTNKEVLVALGERSSVRKLIMLKIVRNRLRKQNGNAIAV